MNKMFNKLDNRFEYLLEGAEINDSLLQAYRNFHLTIQSIFIAIGSGLLVAILSSTNFIRSLLIMSVLLALGIVGIYILVKMHRIIIARGKDVNFWHREIIKAEQSLTPNERYFTKFKIHQKLYRSDLDYIKELFLSDKKIADKEIDLLIERGLGHTRRILDRWLFIGIVIIWMLLLTISIGFIYTHYKAHSTYLSHECLMYNTYSVLLSFFSSLSI